MSITSPVKMSTTQPMPYSDLWPRVIHDPSKLTAMSMMSSSPIDGSRSRCARRTTSATPAKTRVTASLLASQTACACLPNVVWCIDFMSKYRHSLLMPAWPTPMSRDAATTCRVTWCGWTPDAAPSSWSDERVDLGTSPQDVQNVSSLQTKPSLQSTARTTKDANPHCRHNSPATSDDIIAVRTMTVKAIIQYVT